MDAGDMSDSEVEVMQDHDDGMLVQTEGPSSGTMMMLHCLFAVVFAAGTLGLLNCLGFAMRSGSCCPHTDEYSSCEMWRDFRSVLSFVLGALLCCILTRERQTNPNDGSGKVQLYSCLL